MFPTAFSADSSCVFFAWKMTENRLAATRLGFSSTRASWETRLALLADNSYSATSDFLGIFQRFSSVFVDNTPDAGRWVLDQFSADEKSFPTFPEIRTPLAAESLWNRGEPPRMSYLWRLRFVCSEWSFKKIKRIFYCKMRRATQIVVRKICYRIMEYW